MMWQEGFEEKLHAAFRGTQKNVLQCGFQAKPEGRYEGLNRDTKANLQMDIPNMSPKQQSL